MSITLPRAALLPAVTSAGKALQRANTIPILANLRLATGGGRLTVTGTDLDVEISAGAACDATLGEAFTLPSGLLVDAVRKLPEGAEVSIEPARDFCTISAGRARFRLPVLPASDFPEMAATGLDTAFPLAADDLAKMLATVSFAISSEETRYYLNGIHWHVEGENLTAVATDGHRLARLQLPLPAGAADMPGVIIPRRTVKVLQTLLGEVKGGEINVGVSRTKIRFETPAATLTSKLVDGTFPDYRRVVPAGNANHFSLDRAALAAAIDRVTTIGVKGGSVKFGFDDGALKLSASNPDSGSAEEELAGERLAGEPVEIAFNGRYCLDVLSAADTERVVFHLGDPGTPALVRPAGETDERPLFVIMPMRI